MKIGFEIEFAILNLSFEAVENNCYGNSNSLDAYSKIFEDVCDTLEALSIEVLAVHKETGPGQFEIVLNYGDVMETLDNYFMAREAIKAVLRKYSLLTTFIPKSSPITTNGAHVHISIWKDGKNITTNSDSPTKMSDTTQ